MSFSRFSFLILFSCLCGTSAQAQERLDRFFLEGSLTQTLYVGERDRVDGSLSSVLDNVGFGPSISVGYMVSNRLNASLRWLRATYPGVRYNGGTNPFVLRSQSSLHRTTLSPELHWHMFTLGPLEWDLVSGWSFVRGVINNDAHWAHGPVFGGSLLYPVGSFAVGVSGRLGILGPDDALDGSDQTERADMLASAGLLLRWRLPKRTPRPHLEDAQLYVPGTLVTGESGIFTVDTNLDPAEFAITWTLGDGTVVSGASIRHAYARDGIYAVSASIETERRSFVLSSEVTVTERIDPALVNGLSISPLSPAEGDTLTFVPTFSGSDIHCDWDFGDGRSSSRCEPWHVFARPGTYRIQLTVTNTIGQDSLSRIIRVREDVCRGLNSLAPVYFPLHDPELALEMREVLRENFSAVSSCPDRTLVISGHAFDTERNATDLATNRARAVMQYYLNLGFPSSNIRLGRAIVHQRSTWTTEVWRGRQATTRLVRRVNEP